MLCSVLPHIWRDIWLLLPFRPTAMADEEPVIDPWPSDLSQLDVESLTAEQAESLVMLKVRMNDPVLLSGKDEDDEIIEVKNFYKAERPEAVEVWFFTMFIAGSGLFAGN